MMSFRRRICLLSIRAYTQPKFLVNRNLLNKCVLDFATDPLLEKNSGNSSIHIKPQSVEPDSVTVNVGEELVGKLNRADVANIVADFLKRDELKEVVSERGLDEAMCEKAKASFKKYCKNTENLSSDLHVLLCDLARGHGHILDLMPYFLEHFLLMYPHLKYKDELLRIGDLTNPAVWFDAARCIKRKIIFHYGPTNSGKTHRALKSFMEAEKGVYCAPLKLLAYEIFEKANSQGVPCDLVTGEDKRKVLPSGEDANHISCTVEMVSVVNSYDIAVIDEIQMLRDISRGYAWTRAFLGIVAKEIHLCGEASALKYIQDTAQKMGEEVECIQYKRLTKLYFESKPVEKFENIQAGDCIICFSKKELHFVSNELDKRKIQYAVIYGTLPPGTKHHQTKIFNDPKNNCNVLVATDAVGLGLNLNIRRIVFYSLEKKGELIPISLALQIAGRAGRYRSLYEKGFITAFRKKDVEPLKQLLQGTPEDVNKAGLFPTTEQIETFSYYLPGLEFAELIELFNSLCTLSESYFLCDLTNLKRLAFLIQNQSLPIKTMYTFCCAPVNPNSIMIQTLFVRFSKKFSLNEVITIGFMKKFLNWPPKKPSKISDLDILEESFDCLDLYLWFGNRFPILFPDMDAIRGLQQELDDIIMESIKHFSRMVKRLDEDTDDSGVETNLIQKGIISPVLLAKLKREWLKQVWKEDTSKVVK